jgi:hypothetical protein
MNINLALECAFRNLGRGMTHNFHLKKGLEKQDDLEELLTN